MRPEELLVTASEDVSSTRVAPLPTDRVVVTAAAAPLARARAEAVGADLRAAWPGLTVDFRFVGAAGASTPGVGDELGGHGAADAVRGAVRSTHADLGVYAFDELPLRAEPGLVVGAVPLRGDPRDVLVTRTGKVLSYLPPGTRVGAATLGRGAQLLRRRSDLAIVPVAGDVHATLDRLAGPDCDAVVLSAAALADLGLLDRVTEYFDTDQLIPAPGQGGVALEHRRDDARTAALVAPLHDTLSAYAVTAERTCLARLGARNDVAIGVFAVTDGDRMFIHGIVATPDGTRAARLRWTGPWREAEEVGATLAELLLSAGAREILGGKHIPPTINFAELHRRHIAEEWDAPYPPEEA
jgi:hydroxymethylbilane synthase